MGLDISLYTALKSDLPEGTESNDHVGLHWDYSDISDDKIVEIAYYRKEYDIRDLFDKVINPKHEATYHNYYHEVPKESIQKALEYIDANDGTKAYRDLKEVLTKLLSECNFETDTVLFHWIS